MRIEIKKDRGLLLCLGLSLVLGLSGCEQPLMQGMGPKEFIFGTVQFILMAVFIYYIVVIQPERLQEETQKKFLQALKKNDEVLTSGGIFGKVVQVKPEEILVEIAANTRIRVLPRNVKPLNDNAANSASSKSNSGKSQSASNEA